MIVNNCVGEKISSLGLGTMRLPVKDGKIDKTATAEMIDYAIKNGVNYFDTAWVYHGGESETVIGELLKKYPRDSYFIADKFPGFDLGNIDKVEEIFNEQLKKCQVDYFDFYLFHNVCETDIDYYLDEKYRIFSYLKKMKDEGKIRHLGFSVHGSIDVTKRFLDAYGEYMEFCQIQLNYIDWSFQEARKKIELLNSLNIPVWVMEPLRGGKLVSLPEGIVDELKEIRADENPVGMAFRFLQSVPGVKLVLSGMSDMKQLTENIKIFSEYKPFDETEFNRMLNIADGMLGKNLPCTACRYCTSHCPKELDIPLLIKLYNEHSFTNGGFLAPMRLETIPEDKRPTACIGCRSCEAVCPQNIKISDAFKDFVKILK